MEAGGREGGGMCKRDCERNVVRMRAQERNTVGEIRRQIALRRERDTEMDGRSYGGREENIIPRAVIVKYSKPRLSRIQVD